MNLNLSITFIGLPKKLVQSKKVYQIRCGDHRFIDITIAAIEGRCFVHQYKFGKRSWYHAFLEHSKV